MAYEILMRMSDWEGPDHVCFSRGRGWVKWAARWLVAGQEVKAPGLRPGLIYYPAPAATHIPWPYWTGHLLREATPKRALLEKRHRIIDLFMQKWATEANSAAWLLWLSQWSIAVSLTGTYPVPGIIWTFVISLNFLIKNNIPNELNLLVWTYFTVFILSAFWIYFSEFRNNNFALSRKPLIQY